MLSSMAKKPSPSLGWPPNYRARFWSDRWLPYEVAFIFSVVGVFKSWGIFLQSFGLLVVALAAGGVLGAFMDFQSGWIVVAFIPLVIVVVGWVSAILSFPRRTELYAWYRPGSEVNIFVADGAFVVSANSRDVRMGLDDVKRIHRFGALSAIQFRDLQYVVVPSKLLPHWPDPTVPLNLNKRWRKPT